MCIIVYIYIMEVLMMLPILGQAVAGLLSAWQHLFEVKLPLQFYRLFRSSKLVQIK
jgi:hypothetical protein